MNTALQEPIFPEGSIRNPSISLDGQLDPNELLATVLVEEVTSEDLTIENQAVSVAELTINHKAVAIGRAVQFTLSGMLTATGDYKLKVTCTTDSSPVQTLVTFVKFSTEDR